MFNKKTNPGFLSRCRNIFQNQVLVWIQRDENYYWAKDWAKTPEQRHQMNFARTSCAQLACGGGSHGSSKINSADELEFPIQCFRPISDVAIWKSWRFFQAQAMTDEIVNAFLPLSKPKFHLLSPWFVYNLGTNGLHCISRFTEWFDFETSIFVAKFLFSSVF